MARTKKKQYGTISTIKYKDKNGNITREILVYRVYKNPKLINSKLEDTPANREIIRQYQEKSFIEYMSKNSPLKLQQSNKRHLVSEVFKYYLNYLTNVHQRVYSTINGYNFMYNNVFKKDYFIDEFDYHEGKKKSRIEIDVYNFWISSRNKLEDSSRNNIVKKCQYFVDWATDNEYIDFNLRLSKKFVTSLPKNKKPTYSTEEIDLLFNYFLSQQNANLHFIRWFQFINMIGSRLEESLHLTFEDIDERNNFIKMPKKTDKKRFDKIPITGHMKALIDQLKKDAAERNINKNKLFKWNPKSKFALSRKVTLAEIELGIKQNKRSIHGFRRAYSNRLDESIDNQNDLLDLIRHENIGTTRESYITSNLERQGKILEAIQDKHKFTKINITNP